MKHKIHHFIILTAILVLSGCSESKPLVTEISNETTSYDESVYINNCGNKANSVQTASHSFSTEIKGTGTVKAGVEVVEGSVSATYGQYKNITKSQTLTAAPDTNMEFILRWSEDIRAGNVTIAGESANYTVRIPVSVAQVSSQDLGCDTKQNPDSNGTPTPQSSNKESVGSTTNNSTGIVLPTPIGKLLFNDDFEDGFTHGFDFWSGNWQVVDDGTGNKVLQMSGPSTCCADAVFKPSNLSDGIIELRYKVISADYQAQTHVAEFGFRLQRATGNFTTYWLIYEPKGFNLELIYQENGGAWQPVERSSGGGSIQTQEGDWITLRVEFQGENIKVFVNGNPFITAQDSRVKEGELILGSNGPVVVQFDDLKVWEFSK